MNGSIHSGFRFGAWQAFPARNLLLGPSGEIHIEPKVMQVLEYLASTPGQVVEREALLNGVWEGRAFSDEPLSRCISVLRRALGDSSKDPKYIETIPKSGYRLICPVELLADATDDADNDFSEPVVLDSGRVSTGHRRIALPAILALMLAAALYVAYRSTLPGSIESPQLAVEGSTRSAPPAYSIAVLPFSNRSAVTDDAFFVDGIHDDIVTQLARLASLEKVISRTSVEQYRDSREPVQQIGRDLAVATILEGSVQRAGDRVRINVRLIDASNDDRLWAETYDRQLTAENLFAIQSEIARHVAETLRVVLTDEERDRLYARPTASLEAYGEYVRGQRESRRSDAESVRRAQVHFEKAIELDPGYALAYVGLADSIAQQANHADRLRTDTFPQRQAAIDKALVLDPLLGEAYVSLAWLRLDQDQWEGTEEYFLRALKLSPNYALLHQIYAQFLRIEDRVEEALPYARKAIELDPMNLNNIAVLSDALTNQGRIEEALVVLRHAIEKDPEFPRFYSSMADGLRVLGRTGEAMKWIRAGIALAPPTRALVLMECDFYLRLGDDGAAERCLDAAAEVFPENATSWTLVELHSSRSDYQTAVDVSEQIVSRDPTWDNKHYLAWAYLDNGELGKARLLWQELAPEFYGEKDVVVTTRNLELAVFAAHTLYLGGETDRANGFFDQALEVMRSMHRRRGEAFGETDVFIHATRGDKEEALSALRDLVDDGWTAWWWLHSPRFGNMPDERGWMELLEQLDANAAAERQWFEVHKDDPLF